MERVFHGHEEVPPSGDSRGAASGPCDRGPDRLGCLDRLLAPQIRNGDPDELQRARYCVATSGVMLAVVVWSIATALTHGNRAVAAISGGVGLAVAAVLALIRWRGSVCLPSHLLVGLIFLYTVGLAWLSGGEALAALYGGGFVVFAAVLFHGPRTGAVWTAICAAALIGLEWQVASGRSFAVSFPAAHREAVRFWGPVLNVIVMLAASTAFHALHHRSLRRVLEARRRLAASERRYAELVRNAPLGIVACDRDGTVRLANPRLLQMLGSPRDQVDRNVNLFDHAGLQRAGVAGLFRRCLDEGSELSAEVTYDSVYGVRLSARLHLAPIRDEDGQVVGAQAVVEDVSERRRLAAERKRIAARVQEAQRLESLGLLAAGVAHDFNNLLTPILVHAGVLRSELRDKAPEVETALRQIETAATRAGELTAQLLAYAGSRPVDPQPVDLRSVVDEMAGLLRAAVPGRVALVTSLDPDLPPVSGQAAALRQVVLNLVTNACDAIGERAGRVEIRTRRERLQSLPAGSVGSDPFHPGDWLVLEVRDDGCGMDTATRARIFDPFFTTRERGRGLGLAAVLGIVRSHGGFVAIESQPGRGSVFRVFLPPGETRADPGVREPIARDGTSPTGRILVVDDEPAIREAAGRALAAAGYRVATAADGCAALARVRDDPEGFDGVVLDLTMPGMDGTEVLAELRRIRPSVPVLLSSGYAAPDRVRAALELGANGFLAKPYSGSQLASAVDAMLGSSLST